VTAPHTGAEYVRAITARESDRRARSAFRELVLSLVPPGGVVLDFGAGAGLDARYFAERGLRVRAYDNDPRMCAFLAHHCHDLMDGGRIELETGSYGDFLAGGKARAGQRVDLVVANFAPLNLIADLPPLFARFHELTVPGGIVAASVLNPYYIGDAKYRWWWRNLPRLWRLGRYAVHGAEGEIFRRSAADFAAQSAPWFVLERLGAGWRSSGRQFMFLAFRRTQA
jgi:SAM-dependent methyltransferase